LTNVFITDVSAFLPNEPVANDEIEKVLGVVDKMPTRIKKIILRSNDIRRRHYAIDPATGLATHTNAQMTAEAVRQLKPYEAFSLSDIECLSCGTATPDQLMPGHGPMVHGELKSGPCETVSTSGICLSGMTALKYAFMNVALGITRNAVATGSDLASSYLKAGFFEGVKKREVYSKKDEFLPFDTAFLRWMLSDGAGATFMTSDPVPGQPALRIDWIEHISYAGELETCMYSGGKKNANGTITGWRNDSSLLNALEDGAFLIKQDVKLLNREVLPIAVERTLPRVVEKHGLLAAHVDWFLPHYSSEYYKSKFYERLKSADFEIPFDKWFSNLPYKGNTGAASIYIIMEELFHSGRISKGQRLLCFVPESGRFSMCYMLLTAV
jgi:3-oxoacyl-[acyl-carrier-protein] synthase-3